MSRVIGEPISRLDGPAKVSGQGRYTADTPVPGLLFAALVCAPRAHARIARIDLTAASAAPGVVRIFTHRNTPKLKTLANPPAGHTILPLQDDRVLYEGQPVALVVADSLERATEAARLVQVSYRDEPFQTDFLTQLHRAESAPLFGLPPDASTGDVQAAWSESEVKLERTYTTADRHHNTMEPSATIAVWQEGQLLLHDAVQGVVHARDTIAQILQIDPKAVRVRNDFVGGGFAGGIPPWPRGSSVAP